MKIYGVYNVYANNSYDRVKEIDRYYVSKEKALEFIFKEGGHMGNIDEWLIELELIV